MVLAEPPETPPFIDTEIKLKIYINFFFCSAEEICRTSQLLYTISLLRTPLLLSSQLSWLFIGKCFYYLPSKCQLLGLKLQHFGLNNQKRGESEFTHATAPPEDTWHALVGLLNSLATCRDFTGREAGTTEVPVSSAAADHPRSGKWPTTRHVSRFD